jgi:hypothetical protein
MKVAVRRSLILLILLCTGLLSACAPLAEPGQAQTDTPRPLSAGGQLGQSFVAHEGGLNGVQLYLSPGAPGAGSLELSLHAYPGAASPGAAALATASLPLSAITQPAYYTLAFPAQAGSRQQSYYIELTVQGAGSVQVGGSPYLGVYLDGSLYTAGAPTFGQLAFNLTYAPAWAALAVGRQVLTWLALLAAGFFLYILPGWGLLRLLWPNSSALTWPEKLGLGAGLSLALDALLLLAADLLGLRLGAWLVWLPSLVGATALLWSNRRSLPSLLRSTLHAPRSTLHALLPPPSTLHPPLPPLILVILLIFAARLWAVRTAEAPLWGDSVQHAAMTQLILDNGGLFHSWEPYAPYSSLTVQYGFAGSAARLAWLTGLNAVKATLLAGQLFNGLAVLALYPLAHRLAEGQRWAGLAALVIAGLLSPLPGFYVNWGRYAQLTSQVILPVAAWLTWELLRQAAPPSDAASTRSTLDAPRSMFLAALSIAGMSLAYYKMPFYFVPLMAALLMVWGLPAWRLDWRRWLRGLGLLLGAAVLSAVLFLPWGLRLTGSQLAGTVEASAAVSRPLQRVLIDYAFWKDAWVYPYLTWPVTLLAGLGLLWGFFRRQWGRVALGLWALILVSFYALSLLRVPIAGLIKTFDVVIALYIPAAWLGGALLADLIAAWQARPALRRLPALPLALLAAAVWGAWSQARLLEPNNYAFITRPDNQALAWIRKHTPTEARFLVESFRIYNGVTAVGGDAGWWLPLIARRANTMPPQYALLNEQPDPPSYTKDVVQLVANLEQTPPNTPEGLALLCRAGVTHVYIGQRLGLVGFISYQLFSPQALLESPAFELIYRQDGVYVFALRPASCP